MILQGIMALIWVTGILYNLIHQYFPHSLKTVKIPIFSLGIHLMTLSARIKVVSIHFAMNEPTCPSDSV